MFFLDNLKKYKHVTEVDKSVQNIKWNFILEQSTLTKDYFADFTTCYTGVRDSLMPNYHRMLKAKRSTCGLLPISAPCNVSKFNYTKTHPEKTIQKIFEIYNNKSIILSQKIVDDSHRKVQLWIKKALKKDKKDQLTGQKKCNNIYSKTAFFDKNKKFLQQK